MQILPNSTKCTNSDAFLQKKTETLKGCESIKGFLRPLFWKYSRTAVWDLPSIVYENT